jgi:hypothetical protein
MAKVLAVLPFTFLVPFYTALVVENLWNWFVVGTIHGSDVSYWQALGFMMLVTLLSGDETDEKENSKRMFVVLEACVPEGNKTAKVIEAIGDKKLSPWIDLLSPAVGKIVLGTFVLCFGWGVHTFLM